MENSKENRKIFFNNIEPCGDGYSIVDGEKVHINKLDEHSAEGLTEKGDWYCVSKDFGILKKNLTIALAEYDLGNEEQKIKLEDRINEFISSHTIDGLYTVDEFSRWFRRLTGACLQGRDEFIQMCNLKKEQYVTVGFFLNLLEEKDVFPYTMNKLKDIYKDSPKIIK